MVSEFFGWAQFQKEKSVKCFATYFSPQIFEPFWLIWCNEYIQDTTFFLPQEQRQTERELKIVFPP